MNNLDSVVHEALTFINGINDRNRDEQACGLTVEVDTLVSKIFNSFDNLRAKQSTLELIRVAVQQSGIPQPHQICLRTITEAMNRLDEEGVEGFKNEKLHQDGIDPRVLDSLPTVGRLDLYTVRGNLSDNEVIERLAANPNENNLFRQNMLGYIGYEKGEIEDNLTAACWNFAITGCASDMPITPIAFYTPFTNESRNYMREKKMSLEKFINTPPSFIPLSDNDKKVLLSHINEINELIERAYDLEIELESDDWVRLQRDVLVLYLRVCGFEIDEEGESPYAISMKAYTTDDIEWGHWGLQITTDQKIHHFDTMPQFPIGHYNSTFESRFPSIPGTCTTFTIPIKSLNPNQMRSVRNVIDFVVRTRNIQPREFEQGDSAPLSG